MKKTRIYNVVLLVSLLTVWLFSSCEQNLPDNIVKAGALALSASKTTIELNQKNSSNEAGLLELITEQELRYPMCFKLTKKGTTLQMQ